MSGVFQLLTPTPSPSNECILPPHQRRGYTHSPGCERVGVNILEDARHWIGLLQYNPSTLLSHPPTPFPPPPPPATPGTWWETLNERKGKLSCELIYERVSDPHPPLLGLILRERLMVVAGVMVGLRFFVWEGKTGSWFDTWQDPFGGVLVLSWELTVTSFLATKRNQ